MLSNPSIVIDQFTLGGAVVDMQRYEVGHINDTFIVQTHGPQGPRRYILQRINHHVFPQPTALMTNILRVTRFLREKIVEQGGDPERETLTLVPVRDGGYFYVTPDGDYWRVYHYIEGARAYQQVESPEHLYQAARAFGRFMLRLQDFPASDLHIIIPDFHHTPKRFEALMQAADADVQGRAGEVRDLIALAEARVEKMGLIAEALDAGALPQHVTHNDTKFNNVLFDDVTGDGVCVVDLDTVMPGSALYDFGDFVNTAAGNGAEDERNLERVSLNLSYFEAITRGFLQETAGMLTSQEREWLPLSAWLITFELGMRFLTDHLNGDVYFRIHRPNHNLDRARSKFKLALDMEAKEDAMARIVARFC
jgi:hypothetical protein